VGIEDRQVSGPKQLPDVFQVGSNSVGDASAEGQRNCYGVLTLLNEKGDGTRQQRQREERYLFGEETPEGGS
jgi:hypothetical protein